MRTSIKKDNSYKDISAVFVKKDSIYKPVNGLFVKESGGYVNAFPIEQQAFHVLKKYGSNAHLYLPGVGAINGITAGNYLDSAGTTAASVNQPIGLMLDAMGVVGPELFTGTLNFTDASWGKTANVSATGVGTFTTTDSGGSYTSVSGVVASKTYAVRVVGTTSSQMTVRNAAGVSGAYSIPAGSFDVTIRSAIFADAQTLYFAMTGAGSAAITSISVREITGNHASQATTAAKPILRQVPTKLGAELITSQNLTTWTSGGAFGNWTGTTATATTATALVAYGARTLRLPCAPGRSYSFSAAISGNLSQIGISFGTSGAVLIAANPSATSTASGVLRMDATAPVNAAFVEFSVIVVTSGQTATFTSLTAGEGLQVTYAAQFDGVDDYLSLGSTPFQMADDHCVVSAAKPSVVGAVTVGTASFASSASSYQKLAAILFGSTSLHFARWTNSVGADFTTAPSYSYSAGVTLVSSARKTGAIGVHRVNGVQVGSVSISGSATLDASFIGQEGFNSGFFNGVIYPSIAIKGTVSDADLLTLEKFVGSLSGVTL